MRTRLIAGACLVALALSGCGGGDAAAPPTPTGGATSATPEASGSESSGSPAAVPEKLAFSGRTLDGKDFDGASLAGKPVVLWFWAPWCPRCRAAAPDVEATAKAHGDVQVIGVGGLGKAAEMRTFAKDTGISFVNLADESGTVWKKFGVTEQDTFVLIDADGKVVHQGGLSGDELDAKVGELA
ncbi:MAG: TlpA family protein disulfide reductase [Micromonosporaceae bacterium]